MPAVTWQRIPGFPSEDVQEGGIPVSRVRFQVTCWGNTLESASNVAEQVILALRYLSNGDLKIVFIDTVQDLNDPETSLVRRIVEIVAWAKE